MFWVSSTDRFMAIFIYHSLEDLDSESCLRQFCSLISFEGTSFDFTYVDWFDTLCWDVNQHHYLTAVRIGHLVIVFYSRLWQWKLSQTILLIILRVRLSTLHVLDWFATLFWDVNQHHDSQMAININMAEL